MLGSVVINSYSNESQKNNYESISVVMRIIENPFSLKIVFTLK